MSRKATSNRVCMPTQCPLARQCNFAQVETGISERDAQVEASRCLQDPAHSCEGGCPVNVPIHEILECVEKRWYQKASILFREHNLLYGITGLVCPQSEQCEKFCTLCRSGKYPAVSIGAIERFVWEWEQKNGGPQIPQFEKESGKHVAVVGSGPAGLTASAYLRMYGHRVTIFEAFHKMGGVLVYGIPEFRLPKKIVQSEIDYVLSFGGVEKVTDCFISQTYTVQELRAQFDAVFFATGAGEPSTLGIPGQEYPGAMTANEWLTRINLMHGNDPSYETHIPGFKNVVVFGGGNVAMDGARSARRVGIEQNGITGGTNVIIAYRRSRAEMPARAVEIDHATEEGITIEELITPLEILHENGRVVGVKVLRNTLGEPGADGRRKPIPIPDSEFIMPAELVITAIGQKPNPAVNRQIEGVMQGRSGNLRVDALGRTSVPGCFAGGDLARNNATVILAMGDGKTSAWAIDQYLRGKLSWPTAETFLPIT